METYIDINSKWKMIFDFIVIFLTLVYCMELIYQLCFLSLDYDYKKDYSELIFDWLVLVLNIIYVILNFFHSYIDKKTGEIVTKNCEIAKHYLKTWFMIDFISSFPFEFFGKKSSYLRLLRIIRINKIFKFFSFIERVSLKTRHFIALFRLAFFGVFGTFFFACIWYLNSFYNKNNQNNSFINAYDLYDSNSPEKNDRKPPFHSMLICFFFTLTTVTTTGFGDYIAQNVPERILSTLLMLFGVLYFSFLMSLLMEEINIVGDENQTVEAQKLITQLRKFNKGKTNGFISKNINKEILHDVVFASKHSRYEQVTKKENFDILPRKIKDELSFYLWKDVFKQIYDYYDLFEEDKKLRTMLCKLSYYFIFKYYKAKEIIYHSDKIVDEINIIQSGYIDIINYKVMLKKRLKPGDGMGVFYIMYQVRPIYTYTAASGVEVVSISEENFLKVLNKQDAKFYRKFKNVSLTRFKEIFHQINSSKKKKKNEDINNNSGIKKYLISKEDKQKEKKEYEKDFFEIKKCFNSLVNNENYLLGNVYQNESLTAEYKNSFKLEEFIIAKLKQIEK